MALFRHGWICQFIYQFMQLFMDFHGNIMIKHGKFCSVMFGQSLISLFGHRWSLVRCSSSEPSSCPRASCDVLAPWHKFSPKRWGTVSPQNLGYLGRFLCTTWDWLNLWWSPILSTMETAVMSFRRHQMPQRSMLSHGGTMRNTFYSILHPCLGWWSNMIKPQTSFWYGLNQQPAM